MIGARQLASSLVGRLVIGYVLVAGVLAGAWIWTLYGPLSDAVLRQQQRNLSAVAQSAALVAAESTATPEQTVKRLVARTDLRMTIVAADGTVIADSQFAPTQMENHAKRPEVAAAINGRVGMDRRVSRTAGNETLYVAVPGTLDGARVAVRVSQPLSEIEAIAAHTRRIGLVLLGAALLIAFAVSMRATRIVTRPVQRLSAAAERMAGGDLDARVPRVPSDLEGLASALSTLAAQMRARIDTISAERSTLRTTLDGLGDAVFLVEGDTIALTNSAAGKLFRQPAGGFVGAVFSESGLPATLLAEARSRVEGRVTESVDLDPDPTGRAWRLLVSPLPAGHDGVSRAIVVVSDMTDRSRIDRVRRDFVANASHELKTPVAGIRLLAESAETAAADGDTEMALTFTRQIESETERLQHLVTDLLDLSRLESAPSPDAITDVRVAVDRAVLAHRSAATRRGLALDTDLELIRDTDVFIAADPTDLAIALDNLLDNAIAYTEEGSVQLSVRATATTVRIKVSDTGVGIPPEHQARVFERFYRVDRSRSRDLGGTGLGLSLVRHVLERSGGSVQLHSIPGEGSTFTLVLPRAT